MTFDYFSTKRNISVPVSSKNIRITLGRVPRVSWVRKSRAPFIWSADCSVSNTAMSRATGQFIRFFTDCIAIDVLFYCCALDSLCWFCRNSVSICRNKGLWYWPRFYRYDAVQLYETQSVRLCTLTSQKVIELDARPLMNGGGFWAPSVLSHKK